MPTVLLTRPQQDSDTLAAELTEHGISCIISPVIAIIPHAFSPVDMPVDAIILTSRHALHAAKDMKAPCYIVGANTAQAAQAHGLHVAAQAETAEELAKLLPTNKTFLYLSGAHISHPFDHAKRVVVYSAQAQTILSQDALNAFRKHQLSGVVLFSARSAMLFCDLIQHYGLEKEIRHLNAFCLSNTVAQHCNALAWKRICVAQAPSQHAMVELLSQAQ